MPPSALAVSALCAPLSTSRSILILVCGCRCQHHAGAVTTVTLSHRTNECLMMSAVTNDVTHL
eukprot:149577-Amphidinium_carterae.1